MVQKKYTQTQQVIDTLRKTGGYATLGDLYHLVDTKSWATKTGRSDAAKCSLLPLFCQKSKNQKNNSTQITN